MRRVRQGLRRALEFTLPRTRFLVRGPASGGAVALTFDDGPHPDITPRLLDLLTEHGLLATFFVIGRDAARYPELVARIVAEGHGIGHHSYTHSEPATTSTATLLAELEATNEPLWRSGGVLPTIMRPPKGQLTVGKLARLVAKGYRVVLWSQDPKDYAMTSAEPLCTWARETVFTAGDVILLHDVHPHCLAAIPTLAARLRELELTTVPLNAWLPTGVVGPGVTATGMQAS
jgi:peptidoglycan/xylan/chitin deacetylase (PgdA/CDA1 family)